MNDKEINICDQVRYIPVSEWNEYHNWPTHTALRAMIYRRKTNGLSEFGVVKKAAGRILINEQAFFKWVESQNF